MEIFDGNSMMMMTTIKQQQQQQHDNGIGNVNINSTQSIFDKLKQKNQTNNDKKSTTTNTTIMNDKRNNRNRKVFVKDRIKLRCIIDSNPEPYRIRWLLNHRDITMLFTSNGKYTIFP